MARYSVLTRHLEKDSFSSTRAVAAGASFRKRAAHRRDQTEV